MNNNLTELYRIITEMIDEEEKLEKERAMDTLIESVIGLLNFENGDHNDAIEANYSERNLKRQHSINMISLLCLRIPVLCEMIQKGYADKREQLKLDMSEVFDHVKTFEFGWQINDEIVSDALDIILSLSYPYQNIIGENLEYFFSGGIFPREGIEPALYFLFNRVADYYEEHDQIEQAFSVLQYLCQISLERKNKAHQEVVVKVFYRIGERADDLICEIGAQNEEIFENSVHGYARDFYWSYANALVNTKNIEASVYAFNKCHSIGKTLYGEHDWLTTLSKVEVSCIEMEKSVDISSINFLLNFIDNIENGIYLGIDEMLLNKVEGRILYMVLWNSLISEHIPDYKHYLDIYERICDDYGESNEPLIQVRLAKNLSAGYYLKKGKYIQAEKAFGEALNTTVPEGTISILSDAQIKSNLFVIYSTQNDVKMAFPILWELLELLDGEEADTGLTDKDYYRIKGIMMSLLRQVVIDMEDEDMAAFYAEMKEELNEICAAIQDSPYDFKEYAREVMVFVLFTIHNFITVEYVDMNEQLSYFETLCDIERNADIFKMDQILGNLLYYLMSVLACDLNRSDTERYIRKSLKYVEMNVIPIADQLADLEIAAIYMSKCGKSDLSIQHVNRGMKIMTEIWHSYVQYLNDMRLLSILMPIQEYFRLFYNILRAHTSIEYTYEKLLQFKAIASLAGKERNRIIQSSKMDEDLLEEIRILQDGIAALEAENTFRDTYEETVKETQELRELETRFAVQFPDAHTYTEITFEKVKDAIPEGSAVVEYCMCSSFYELDEPEQYNEETDTGFDIYIIRKENGTCVLNKITVWGLERIVDEVYEFVEILQAESNDGASIEQLYKIDDLRYDLYESLVEPILPYIKGTDTLYIAPDAFLINLPFELLYGEDEERLEECYNIIKIECARDLLFDTKDASVADIPSAKGTLLIGNPKYKVNEQELGDIIVKENSDHRGFSIESGEIYQLPFSEMEVQQISRYSDARYYSGFAASKNVLLSAEGYENIHIATHGFFDLTEESNSIYSSCLIFAGVRNWLETGNISDVYGNGIVTADEISRMNLQSTKLVVLSSCLSGMNQVSVNKGFQGMVGALSAAGVQYVISHLWSANDFSTAILMDEFYYQYMEKKQSPPAALALAKNYLKNVRIGELKKKSWFDKVKRSKIDDNTKSYIEKYEDMDEKVKPFMNEAFWGGFVCYKCN